MVKTLRESKAKLSELVELASRGEDVLISVRGKVKARLTRAAMPERSSSRSAWMRELRALRARYAPSVTRARSEAVLAEIREDRA